MSSLKKVAKYYDDTYKVYASGWSKDHFHLGIWDKKTKSHEELLEAIVALGDLPRLRELGQLYEQYQIRLQQQDWDDYAGFGWLAVEALENNAEALTNKWPWLIVNGFDSFTEVQLSLFPLLPDFRQRRLCNLLSGQAGETLQQKHLECRSGLHRKP